MEVVKSLGRVQVPGHRFASPPAAPALDDQEGDADGNAKNPQPVDNKSNNDGNANKADHADKAEPQDDTKQQQALGAALKAFAEEDDQRRLAAALKTLGG